MDATRTRRNAFLFSQTKTTPKGLDPRLLEAIRAAPLLSKDAEVTLTTSIVTALAACWSACAAAFIRESRREEMFSAALAALPTQRDPADTTSETTEFSLTAQPSTASTIASIRARDLDWFALRAAQAFTLSAMEATTSTQRSSAANVQRATEARRAVLSAAAILERLVDRMTRANMRLVLLIASKERPGLPYADLVQEGSTGLLKAIRRFDPSRGLRFSTFAVNWIRADLGRANDDKGALIRRPVHVIDATPKAIRAHEALTETLGRTPTHAEVAKVIKRSADVAEAALSPARTVSTNATVNMDRDNPITLGELLPDPNVADWTNDAIHAEDCTHLRAGVNLLADREREILRRRFGLDSDDGSTAETLADIGASLNYSRERIRQIESAAIVRLRRLVPRLEGAQR